MNPKNSSEKHPLWFNVHIFVRIFSYWNSKQSNDEGSSGLAPKKWCVVYMNEKTACIGSTLDLSTHSGFEIKHTALKNLCFLP